jgi:hypothetical protein
MKGGILKVIFLLCGIVNVASNLQEPIPIPTPFPEYLTTVPLSLDVIIDSTTFALVVPTGGSLKEYARAFCDAHNIVFESEDGYSIERALIEEANSIARARDIEEKEEQARLQQLLLLDAVNRARQATQDGNPSSQLTPRASISVNLNSETFSCDLFPGESPQEAARRFCAKHGIARDEEYDSVLRLLVNRLRAAIGMRDGLPYTTEETETIFSLHVNVADGTGRLLKMRVLHGESPAEAARGFLDRAGFDSADEVALTLRAEAKYQELQLKRAYDEAKEWTLSRILALRRERIIQYAGEGNPSKSLTEEDELAIAQQAHSEAQRDLNALISTLKQTETSSSSSSSSSKSLNTVSQSSINDTKDGIITSDISNVAEFNIRGETELRTEASLLKEEEGFVIEINVDNKVPVPLPFRFGQQPEAVAQAFVSAMKLDAHPNASSFVEVIAEGVKKRLDEEIKKKQQQQQQQSSLERINKERVLSDSMVSDASIIHETKSSLVIPTEEAVRKSVYPRGTAHSKLVVPLSFGNLSYDIEVSEGDTYFATSRAFCVLEWNRLEGVMIEALGEKEDEEGGKNSVTIDSCAQIVSPVIEKYFEETKV